MTQLLSLIALGYIGAAATAFVIVYHVTARWWETPFGINMMVLIGALAGVCDLVFVFVALDRPPWMSWVFDGLYVVIGTTLWWRLRLLVQAQRPKRPPAA